MFVKATVLSENTVYGHGGVAEHGWAVWLETLSRNVLFDTGQGKVLLHNAHLFSIDLSTVRAICISHHHYDHTGGLLAALQAMRGGSTGTGVPIYAHPDLFKKSYSIPPGKKPRHIAMPFTRAALEGTGALFRLEFSWREIEYGVYMTGEVPRHTGFEKGDPELKHHDDDGALVVDPVLDDQALVVDTPEGLFVVLGCSHAGVVNVLNHIVEQTGCSRIHTVIGGTHLKPAGEEQISKTIDALQTFDVARLGVSHCTGLEAARQMAQAFGDRFFTCNVGTVIEL
jgi:7,8-dihydropterin-6-yl-methyl-4-(beta-D-ribofuranosyl)aminobenzene 5'-phosphate synthase